jgi:hypothetical protein
VPPAPGYFDLGISSRNFDAPLFGGDLSTSYRLYASQTLIGGSNLQFWLHGGFPEYTTSVGLRATGIQAGRLGLGVEAGDFQLGTIQPEGVSGALSDSYPLTGLNVTARAGNSTWRLFAGESRFELALPGESGGDTQVIGSDWLGRFGEFTFGAGVSTVSGPVAGGGEQKTTVVSGRFEHALMPRAGLFGEGFLTDTSGLGYRVGLRWTLFNAEVSTALYGFDEELPLLYPLYRPGEHGIELRGRWRPTQLASLFGSIYYADDDSVRSRSELRGSIGAGIGFGSNRPHLSFHYSHDEVVYQLLSEEGRIADRISVAMSQRGAFGHIDVRAEHAFNGYGTELDRSQVYAIYRGISGLRSFVHGSLLAQRDEASNVGITVEAAIERPWRGPYYWLAGLGTAWVDRNGSQAGEGLARLGVSRRMANTGWYLRFEARVPMSIGLQRSDLGRNTLALDLGNRFEWSDLRDLASRIPGHRGRQETGAVEGRVTDGVSGLRGIPVLIDGRPMATTDRDGQFRIGDLAVGTASVTLDLRAVEPGFDIDGDAYQTLQIVDGATVQAHFTIGRFTAIQGAVVRCEGERLVPVVNAEIALSVGDGSRAFTTTTAAGSFQFDRMTPGVYLMTVTPERADSGSKEDTTTLEVDLTEDVFGYILRLGCPLD